MAETMMIFMMMCAERGTSGNVIAEEGFQTLTGCLEYATTINCQNVFTQQGICISGQNRFFECHCRPRTIARRDAGSTIYFRDPVTEKDDD